MGIFDQAKMAAEMMKGMQAGDMNELIARAKESRKLLHDEIKQIVSEEIERRGLVSRADVEDMLKRIRS